MARQIRRIGARQVNLGLLVFLSIAVVLKLRLDLILTSTTPTGGDNAGHVWTADYVRREMLPHLRLTGWSNDWFGGVPVLGFYFPLPSWMIVALSFLMPYEIAYKLVTIVGIATLPLACHRLGSRASLNSTRSLFLGLSAFPFLFARHFRILGGNILSTMAGEFSFSIGLTLVVIYAGLLLTVLRTGQRRAATAGVLALAGLSHIVPTIFALAFTIAATCVELRRDTAKRQLTDVVTVGVVGGLCAGFWLLPFAKNLPYTNSMDYERYTRFIKTLFPFFSDSSSLQTPKDGMLAACAALVLAAVAVVVGWIHRDRFVMILTITMAIIGVVFRLSPQSAMWNIRLLPLWFFCAYLLAGQTIGAVVHRMFVHRLNPTYQNDQNDQTINPIKTPRPINRYKPFNPSKPIKTARPINPNRPARPINRYKPFNPSKPTERGCVTPAVPRWSAPSCSSPCVAAPCRYSLRFSRFPLSPTPRRAWNFLSVASVTPRNTGSPRNRSGGRRATLRAHRRNPVGPSTTPS